MGNNPVSRVDPDGAYSNFIDNPDGDPVGPQQFSVFDYERLMTLHGDRWWQMAPAGMPVSSNSVSMFNGWLENQIEAAREKGLEYDQSVNLFYRPAHTELVKKGDYTYSAPGESLYEEVMVPDVYTSQSLNFGAIAQQVYDASVPSQMTTQSGGADWNKIINGTVTTVGGTLSTVFGVVAVASGVGVPAGAAGVTFGVPTIGFGVANVIDGFRGRNQYIPSGSIEAIDIGFGGDGSIGQIGDIFSGGLPKNVASGLIMGYGIYNSNFGQRLFNNSTYGINIPVLDLSVPQDKTKVIIPVIYP